MILPRDIDLCDDSVVELYPLAINQERNWYGEQYVGRGDLGHFALPTEGVMVLRLLQHGLSLGQVAERMGDWGDGDVNVFAFVRDLCDLGFVHRVDGRAVSPEPEEAPSSGPPLPALNRWPGIKPVIGLCIVIAVAGAMMAIGMPQYLPRWRDFFWHESYSLLLVVGFVANWLFLAVHESAHLAVARALGIRGTFSLSTRLWFVVGQTRLRGLWHLPKRERCLVYLSGMLCDAVLAALFVFYLWSHDHLGPLGGETGYRLAKAMILVLSLRIAWQLNIYMRTDIYGLLVDLFDCKRLFDDAKMYLYDQVRFLGRRNALKDLPAGEKRVVRLYSLILLAGTAVALLGFVFYQVPAMIVLVKDSVLNLTARSLAQWRQPQWDSAMALALISFNYLLTIGLSVWGNKPRVSRLISLLHFTK